MNCLVGELSRFLAVYRRRTPGAVKQTQPLNNMDHGIMDHKEDGRDLLSIEEIKSFAVNYPDKFGTLERACNIVTVGTHVDGQFTISSLDFVLLPLKIIECNALNNVSFSDAYCNVQQYKDICICFAGLFKKGCSDLVDFLRDNKVPTDESRRKALRKLVTFFAKDFGEHFMY